MAEALPIFCADAAEQAGEPLAGTAAHAHAWILVEEPGVWERDPIDSPGLASERAVIEAWLAAIPKSRLQLIRRPRHGAGGRRVMLALPAEGRVVAWTAEMLAAVPMVAATSERELGEPVTAPLHLVCTHGKRDRCCALRGMALYRALAAIEGCDVWQTSHLGGHRFAATTVSFPFGYALGHVQPDEAAQLHTHAGLHDLARLRGRVCYDEPTQAAEITLRRALAELAPTALRWEGTSRDETGWQVRFARDDASWTLRVHAETLDPTRPKSCGDAPSAIQTFVATIDGPT